VHRVYRLRDDATDVYFGERSGHNQVSLHPRLRLIPFPYTLHLTLTRYPSHYTSMRKHWTKALTLAAVLYLVLRAHRVEQRQALLLARQLEQVRALTHNRRAASLSDSRQDVELVGGQGCTVRGVAHKGAFISSISSTHAGDETSRANCTPHRR